MPESENISLTKRIIILISIALLVIAILFFISNPKIIEKIWLWIIGLIGPIVAFFKNIANSLTNLLKEKDSKQNQPIKNSNQQINLPKPEEEVINNQVTNIHLENSNKKIAELENEVKKLQLELKKEKEYDGFNGTTLTVLRYMDDGETTLGLLFLEDKFFCYTLEDTYNEVKLKNETRIPEGIYDVGFNKAETDMTKSYRVDRPWFKYHLHIKNVPNYTSVYIHVGNTNEDTAGCLLVADSITANNIETTIYNSREAFKRLYLELKPLIDKNEAVRIKYYDEDWFKRFKLKRIIA